MSLVAKSHARPGHGQRVRSAVMDDVAVCTNVIHRIAEAMDAADYLTLRLLLEHADLVDGTSGAVLASGGEAAVAHFQSIVKVHDDGTWRTKHVTTNPIVEVDEALGTATCRSYYTVFQQIDDGPLEPIVAGRYHDRFERVADVWRFTERDYSMMDLVGDVSRHLRRS